MYDDNPVHEDAGEKKKKSQTRAERQARKRERRALREMSGAKKGAAPVKARLQKKSLPGFMAKNAETILQWLKDYMLLFILADDYGISNMQRIPEERRRALVQNYVDVGDFTIMLQDLLIEQKQKNSPAAEQP